MRPSRKVSLNLQAWMFFITIALVGCQTTPTIRTQIAPDANLAQYHTYDYFEKLGTDKHGYTTITTRDIQMAVDREMRGRGFVRGPSPDILINLNISKQDKTQSVGGPDYGVGFGGWRRGFGYGGWGGWGGDEIETVTEGTLTIDLVNRSRNELIWTGSATRVLNAKILDQPKPAIDQAVKLIFERFPIGVSGSGTM
jgi:hypothetical protein